MHTENLRNRCQSRDEHLFGNDESWPAFALIAVLPSHSVIRLSDHCGQWAAAEDNNVPKCGSLCEGVFYSMLCESLRHLMEQERCVCMCVSVPFKYPTIIPRKDELCLSCDTQHCKSPLLSLYNSSFELRPDIWMNNLLKSVYGSCYNILCHRIQKHCVNLLWCQGSCRSSCVIVKMWKDNGGLCALKGSFVLRADLRPLERRAGRRCFPKPRFPRPPRWPRPPERSSPASPGFRPSSSGCSSPCTRGEQRLSPQGWLHIVYSPISLPMCVSNDGS